MAPVRLEFQGGWSWLVPPSRSSRAGVVPASASGCQSPRSPSQAARQEFVPRLSRSLSLQHAAGLARKRRGSTRKKKVLERVCSLLAGSPPTGRSGMPIAAGGKKTTQPSTRGLAITDVVVEKKREVVVDPWTLRQFDSSIQVIFKVYLIACTSSRARTTNDKQNIGMGTYHGHISISWTANGGIP